MAPGEGIPFSLHPVAEGKASHCLLLQKMETGKKKADDKGEQLHSAQAKGSKASEQEEPTHEGNGYSSEPHLSQGHNFTVVLK